MIDAEKNLESEITFNDYIRVYKKIKSLFIKNILKISIISLIAAFVGIVYAYLKPISYTSNITFVVEDSKASNSLSGLASLAGQFGLDFGANSSSGLISGDNIFYYFKSETLALEILKLPWDEKGKISLADRYIEVHNLKKSWSSNKNIGIINFPPITFAKSYSRMQDSLLQVIVRNHIQKKQFSIKRIDKKAGFIQISVTMNDEQLSKKYSDLIVDMAVKNYINIKTIRQQKTIDNLQNRVDSIANVLFAKTSKSVKLQTQNNTLDINPLFRDNQVLITEITNRDKTVLLTMFAEATKNLELAKITLNQETPVIQIVDRSNYPLIVNKTSKLLFGSIFFIISFCVSSLFFTLKSGQIELNRLFDKQ